MFDDVVRNLTDARYSSDEEEHYLSWSCGAKRAQGDYGEWFLKIVKGSIIVTKGARGRNLYYLKGSTVTGVMTTSVDLDEDASKTWHMRLGHAGRKSMQALASKAY